MATDSNTYQPREDEILWDIEAKHLDEAEFIFETWEAALEAPHYTLAELAAGPEQRLLAHVDALVVGGPLVAERLLLPTIEDPDSNYERVAAATLGFCAVDPERRNDRVLLLLAGLDEGDQQRGVMRALELIAEPDLNTTLVQAIDSAHGSSTAAILEILGRRRARVDGWVSSFLQSEDPLVVRAAVRLVRYCVDHRALEGLGPLARSVDSTLRRAALETALCRQVSGAWESAIYWAFASGESPFRRDALLWIAMLGDAAAHQRLLTLLDSPVHRADALWALGFTGRVAAVERCIGLLDKDEAGRLAAEVICAITGLPTDEDSFWASSPAADDEAQSLPELQHDDLDGDLAPDAEAALPVPDPESIAWWWQTCRDSFDPAIRYLNGQPFTGRALIDAFSSIPMRRRHALALELEFRTSGTVLLDTRALCTIQQVQLGALAPAKMPNFQRGLPLPLSV